MKKLVLPFLLAILMVCGSAASLFVNINASAIQATDEYSASNFSALPADWTLSPLCDVPNVTTSFNEGCIQIKSTSTANQSKYYGALYEIAKNKTYGDFTFEMKFKMDSPADNNRWLGVMYHTQTAINGNLTGYLMNFRYSGGSAASAVTSALSFRDEAQIPSGVPLNDGAMHTLTIVMRGTTSRHYIDGKLITEFDTTIKNADLGGSPLTEGGFALIVNRSTVTVRSIKIKPSAQQPASGELTRDTELAKTYYPSTTLIGAPTVISDVKSKSVLDSICADVRPQSAILHFDADANIMDEKQKVIGTFSEIYEKLDHKIIPIVELKDSASAEAFIEYTENVKYIADIAILSENPEIIKTVRTALPHVRAILEYKNFSNLYEIVKTATLSNAMTVIIPQEKASYSTVEYLQARFKSVWVRQSGKYGGDAFDCIANGAYGIVTDDFLDIYDAFEQFDGGYTRNIFNVAHRGLQSVYNENSLGAIRGAMENGATHLELDAHLTADKHIVLNHDDRIDRETNGSGEINRLTLEQIKKYDLTLKTPHEKIPTLDEALELIDELNESLETKVVLVLEIKDDSEDFVENLKKVLDEKNFYEDLVIIVFENTEHQLAKLKAQIPQVPVAVLDTVSDSSFSSMLTVLNSNNAGIDNPYSAYNANYERILQERGFSGWYWTFSTEADVAKASKNGIVGCTNNVAACAKDYIRYVTRDYSVNCKEADVPSVGDEIELDRVSYDGTVNIVIGKVYYTEATDKGWRIFCSYTESTDGYERTVYTQGINYYKPDNKLALILGISIPCGLILIAAAITGPLVIKKRKADR